MSLPLSPDFIAQFKRLCQQHGQEPLEAASELAADFAFEAAAQTEALVLLPSGRVLDLVRPTPLDIEPADIVAGQVDIARWGGATNGDNPVRDAQHALLVREILVQDHPNLHPAIELAGLVHDGPEGPLGFDPISPLRPFLGTGLRRIEAGLQATIHARVGLPRQLPKEWKDMIKAADLKAAASEAHHMTPWSADQIRKSLKIKGTPLRTDPLVRRFNTAPWRPWSRHQATEFFGAELDRLMKRVALAGVPAGGAY